MGGDGAFDIDENGVLNFVDLKRDGTAQLLFHYIETVPLSGAIVESLVLYTISDGYFRRTDGVFAGHLFPIHSLVGARIPQEPDLTNAPPGKEPTQHITTFKRPSRAACSFAAEITVLDDGGVGFNTRSAKSKECEGYFEVNDRERLLPPLILVLDSLNGERLIDINRSLDEIAKQIVGSKARAQFVGRSCETGCRPFIMWAVH